MNSVFFLYYKNRENDTFLNIIKTLFLLQRFDLIYVHCMYLSHDKNASIDMHYIFRMQIYLIALYEQINFSLLSKNAFNSTMIQCLDSAKWFSVWTRQNGF